MYWGFFEGKVAMLKEEIENLREKINCIIVTEGIKSTDLLKASQEMDILIVEYLRKTLK